MQLSPHFSLEEMTKSPTAEARHISNQLAVGGNKADAQIIENLKALCLNVLEPLREALGEPIKVTSGFRCPALNKAVGGSRTSQHMKGQAVDIVCSNNKRLFDLAKGLDFDQLIWEGSQTLLLSNGERIQAPRWIHVSYRADGKNRRQILYK